MLQVGCHARVVWIFLLASACVALPAHAQQVPVPASQQQQQQQPPFPSSIGPTIDRNTQLMLRQMARERNVDRQKEIVADTQKLLDLAKKLKDEVDKSNKDQLSISVVDTANQIEKLARTVKERMRDGT